MTKEPKILYYDIETTPIRVWTFRLGDQYVDHSSIVDGDKIDIICITYCWNKGPAKSLDWGYEKQDSSAMIAEFDKLVAEADITIGQNSDNFDVKHINTQRLLHGLPPFPDWADCTDDTLKQLKKYFKFPTNRLDYISKVLGFGGKNSVKLQDWINIVEKNEGGEASFKRMIKYGKKDVEDTRAVFKAIKPYIKPKLNMATFNQDFCCTNCGSINLKKNGTRVAGKTRYQYFYCNEHGGYAGKAPINKRGLIGSMGV
jgi:DNA polymerase elongation subunit (family B)